MSFFFSIQEDCQQFSPLCIRMISSSIWAFTVTVIAIVCIIRIYNMKNCYRYEMCPLLSSATQATLHFIQFLWYQNNQLTLVTNYIQIITFAFLGQSFANLYYRISIHDRDESKNKYRKVLSVQAIFYSTMLLMMILYIHQVDPYSCNDDFYIVMALILIQIVITCLITDHYGFLLLKEIDKMSALNYASSNIESKAIRAKIIKTSRSSVTELLVSRNPSQNESAMISERKRQIEFMMIALTITTLCYLLALPLIYVSLQELVCEFNKDLVISAYQNFYLAMLSILQMTPCIYLSIAFYYMSTVERIDSQKTRVEDDFNLHNSLRKDSLHQQSMDEDLFISRMSKKQEF